MNSLILTSRRRRVRGKRVGGMALVITLSLVVLVTIVVMAFFARTITNQTVEASRTHGMEVGQLLMTAQDYAKGEFIKEIIEHSTVVELANNTTIYRPKTNMYAVPQRVVDSSMANNDTFLNLVRQSRSLSSNGVGVTNASAHNCATPSKNGRVVDTSRWNQPLLLTGAGFISTDQLPRWIYLNKDGSITATPSGSVVGRFAFNVYDVGGLLDANLAGHPISPALTESQLKEIRGTLAGVDLQQIPGFENPDTVNSFIQWRNFKSSGSSAEFVSGVTNSAFNGGVIALPGDNRFRGRQDLIKYAATQNQLLTNALPYLSSFNRFLNEPTFAPSADRPKSGTLPGQASYPLVSSGLDDNLNPDILSVRVTVPFTRTDGSVAAIGEPLVKQRYPLSRLGLLGSSSGGEGSSSNIYKLFGLTRSSISAPWVYNHGATDRILSLNEVATLGRDADFFELLQAVINVGSLGKSIGTTMQDRGLPDPDANCYNQVIQIGCNLIDQYDADSYPTVIQFGNSENVGIENLPYLARIFTKTYRLNSYPGSMSAYFQPEVWNPHQAPVATGSGPTEFRFVAKGASRISFQTSAGWNYPPVFSPTSGAIAFSTASESYREPLLLSPSHGAEASGLDNVADGSFVGLHIFTAPNVPPPTSAKPFGWIQNADPEGISFMLQYRDPAGNWISYSAFDHIRGSSAVLFSLDPDRIENGSPYQLFLGRADPRTQRFGSGQSGTSTSDAALGNTMRPNYQTSGYALQYAGGGYPGWTSSDEFGLLSQNNPPLATFYQDADGIVRRSDGAYSSGVYGQPMQMGSGPGSRPVVLDRPFQSVGEMGYAFRDMPWKSLDFFTPNSGDAALLDIFCLYEQGPKSVVAGKFNLNTRLLPILKSALVGSAKKSDGDLALSDEEATKIASRILLTTSSSPLINPSDLAQKVAPSIEYTDFSQAPEDGAIKERREVIVRSLVDFGDTRMWNLLVDMVAQTGRFSGGGTTESDFSVDGESRNWLHFTVDRYTGKIIDESAEAVPE